jgi:hypothetical protein
MMVGMIVEITRKKVMPSEENIVRSGRIDID